MGKLHYERAENCALARARKALWLQNIWPSDHDEPFAAIILYTSDPGKVDKRTRSKWSRVLRYAAEYRPSSEPLAAFIQRKGGINKSAVRFTRCLGRGGRKLRVHLGTSEDERAVGCDYVAD